MAPPRLVRQGDGQVVLAALPNEERCYVCHGDDHALRGLLAVSCDGEPEGGPADPSREEALPLIQGAFATGFRSMMLVEAGTHAGEYVDAVRQEPFVAAARVFSEREPELVELYVPNPDPRTAPPSIVDSVLTMIRRVNQAALEDPVPDQLFVERRDGQPFLVQVKAIKNELRCQVCHAPPRWGARTTPRAKTDGKCARSWPSPLPWPG